jgi:hypothetical protein
MNHKLAHQVGKVMEPYRTHAGSPARTGHVATTVSGHLGQALVAGTRLGLQRAPAALLSASQASYGPELAVWSPRVDGPPLGARRRVASARHDATTAR